MTSIVLAGGRSSRFGWSKALKTISGKSLVQWVVERLATLSTEIVIVTAQRSAEVYPRQFGRAGDKPPRYDASLAMTYPPSSSIKMVADIYPGKGPLGGIYTGLVTLASLRAIVVGCDMPFLSVTLLDYMAQISSAFDVVVPQIGEWVEPLCAVYSKNCLVPIQRLLERNELRISELFNAAKVRYIEEDEINRFDPEHLSFFNINTQADLDEARKLAAEKGWLPR